MSAIERQNLLAKSFYFRTDVIKTKEDHLNNISRLVLLKNEDISDINSAIAARDNYISLGFEGLVIREKHSEYQFGGRRNNSMLKFKKKEDGLFEIIDIVPEGVKRSHLPKFVMRNDINDELFTCTLNAPQSVQENILQTKDNYLNGEYVGLVEFRERSGVNQVPFHAKLIKLCKK